jgi:multidrug resistance efflux pump
VNDAARLTELVKAALVTPEGQTLLLSTPVASFRINDSKTKYVALSYREGTILAYLENDQADQELNAAMLGVLPAERLQRQQRNEKIQRAKTLGKLDASQQKQTNFLKSEIQQRRELYKRYFELWKRGDLPGITLLDEQSRINTLEGQLLSANSTQITSKINQDDQIEQSKQAEVASIDSLNKLENQLITYLNNTAIFAPVGGLYILTRNFLNGSLVKQGDELITFTRTPPALPSPAPTSGRCGHCCRSRGGRRAAQRGCAPRTCGPPGG